MSLRPVPIQIPSIPSPSRLYGESTGPPNPAERNVSTTFIQFACLNAWPDLPLTIK